MPDINVTLTLGRFPEGFCYESAQQFADALVGLLSGTVPSTAGVIIGPDVPGPAYYDNVWVRLVAGYLEGIYTYNGGWFRPHPIPPLSPERRMWVGLEDGSANGIWKYDGGSGLDPSTNIPTETTGAMWEVDHNYDFRLPMGPGTSALGIQLEVENANAHDGGGEEVHSLLATEMPPHYHQLPDIFLGSADSQVGGGFGGGLSLLGNTFPAGGTLGVVVPHNNIPPVWGTYIIKRTARRYISPL